jgi:hypothetical protein
LGYKKTEKLPFWGMKYIAIVCHRINVIFPPAAVLLLSQLRQGRLLMPPPAIGKARELDPPPRRWPAADLGYDPRLDHGGMKFSEHRSDDAPQQETGVLARPAACDFGNDSGLAVAV